MAMPFPGKRFTTNARITLPEPATSSPWAKSPALEPSSSITGVPAKSGSVVPSSTVFPMRKGRTDAGRMV
jgi:hypothetical protein